MANVAKLDENSRPALTAVSNADANTIVPLYADPVTHRLLVDLVSGGTTTVDAGTTTTLVPGSSATVVNSGTTTNAVFDFGIPAGAVIYSTFGPPAVGVGVNGDWAFDTSTNAYVYYKSGGAWAQVNSIKGATGATGATGPAGPTGLVWFGTYDAGTLYKQNDAVAYLGTSYIYVNATPGTGHTPADDAYWDILALKGTDGTGSGDVMGPATNTADYIPQWNGANSKTLKDGLAVPAGGLAGLTLVGTKCDKLTPTAIKTSAYNAVVNDIVLCDISGGSFAVTLPNAPADKSQIKVVVTSVSDGYALEMKTSGIDVFNRAAGPTSAYMGMNSEFALLQYEASTKIWYITNGANTPNFAVNFPGIDAATPITNADISINTSTRVLTITPPLGYFNILVTTTTAHGKITRFRKSGTITFPAFTDTSGMWYFYFDSAGTATTTQTAWTVEDFDIKVPVYRLLWNATLYNFTTASANVNEGDTYTNNGQTFTVRQTATATTLVQMVGTGAPAVSGNLVRATGTGTDPLVFSAVDSTTPRLVAQYVEYHPNTISADTHQWFHIQGTVWESGFTMANNALTTGSPNADGRNTVVALSTGTNMDDNLDYTVTNNTTGNPWTQDMGNTTPASLNATNSAMFTVFRQRADGTVTFRTATRFPFDWSIATNIPQYLTATGVRTPVTNQRFMVNFIYATPNPVVGNAIKVVSATQDFTTLANAQAYTWTNIQNTYSLLNDGEIRPMYRLIHEVHTSTPNTYDVGAKYSVLRETQDLRKAAVTSTTASTGSLPATSVTVIPAGNISSTNAQSALEELDAEKLPIAGGTMTGNLLFTDNTLDIGANGATRPRTLYAGTSVITPAVRITTSPTNGYVLTSDGSGNGTWQAPTGSSGAGNSYAWFIS